MVLPPRPPAPLAGSSCSQVHVQGAAARATQLHRAGAVTFPRQGWRTGILGALRRPQRLAGWENAGARMGLRLDPGRVFWAR